MLQGLPERQAAERSALLPLFLSIHLLTTKALWFNLQYDYEIYCCHDLP